MQRDLRGYVFRNRDCAGYERPPPPPHWDMPLNLNDFNPHLPPPSYHPPSQFGNFNYGDYNYFFPHHNTPMDNAAYFFRRDIPPQGNFRWEIPPQGEIRREFPPQGNFPDPLWFNQQNLGRGDRIHGRDLPQPPSYNDLRQQNSEMLAIIRSHQTKTEKMILDAISSLRPLGSGAEGGLAPVPAPEPSIHGSESDQLGTVYQFLAFEIICLFEIP